MSRALRVICGPTGAGKSALAMALARRHGLRIISADSRQVYRGFDVGTAKPSTADRAAVPHDGIDVADPRERWSAARWATDAIRWIEDAGGPQRVLVVGGTGLYLRALTQPFFAEPPLDPDRRARLAAVLADWPTAQLRDAVRALDGRRAHLGRTQLLRAIEVAVLSGRRLSELHDDARTAPAYRARWLVVDPGALLQEQIAGRLDAMLGGGWLEEVRALDGRVPPDAPAWQACGYSALREYVHGRTTFDQARTAILVHTRQYAKRQRTWFRHQLAGSTVTRLDPRAPRADDEVAAWWSREDA